MAGADEEDREGGRRKRGSTEKKKTKGKRDRIEREGEGREMQLMGGGDVQVKGKEQRMQRGRQRSERENFIALLMPIWREKRRVWSSTGRGGSSVCVCVCAAVAVGVEGLGITCRGCPLSPQREVFYNAAVRCRGRHSTRVQLINHISFLM